MNRMRVMGEKGVRNFLVTHQKSWLQNSRCKTFPAEYDKSLSRNSFYETFWLFLKKVYHETFSTEPFFTCFKKSLSRNLQYETFSIVSKHRFSAKPLVRNFYFVYKIMVWQNTAISTKPKKVLPLDTREEPFLVSQKLRCSTKPLSCTQNKSSVQVVSQRTYAWKRPKKFRTRGFVVNFF